MKRILILLLIISLILGLFVPGVTAQSRFPDLTRGAWYEEAILFLAQESILSGYEDGTFRPGNQVTVAEFLTLTLRALEYDIPATSGAWSAPYIELGRKEGFYDSNSFANFNSPIQRKDAAMILNRALSLDVSGREIYSSEIKDYAQIDPQYRDYALNIFGSALMEGYPDGTIRFDHTITRAEAACLIRKIVLGSPPVLIDRAAQTGSFHYRGISLNDTRDQVVVLLGQPDRVSQNQWGYQWYVYNRDYRQFAMIGIRNGVVHAFYSNVSLDNNLGLHIGSPYGGLSSTQASIAAQTFNEQYNTFRLREPNGDTLLDVYIDQLGGNKISGLFYRRADGNGTAYNSTIQNDMAKDLLDLVNATRVMHNQPVLSWCSRAAQAAVLHAQDMHDRNYFSHTSPEGKDPQDRLDAQSINWGYSGENLAAGQGSVFLAHNGLLNSASHRSSLLSPNFKRLGTGIWIGSNGYRTYYVENFYTSR